MTVENLVTLSLDGTISDPVQKADRLLSYFFVNDHHQSNNQLGYIASLPGIIKDAANKPDRATGEIQSALYQLFSRYYESVNCDVTVQDPSGNHITGNDMAVNLLVNLTFKQNGQTYNLGRIAKIVNSKIAGVAEVVTNGT